MASEAITLAKLAAKREKAARAYEREKFIMDKLLTPAVVRTALVATIIAYSTYCARSEENVGPVQSALAFALPGIGIPLIAAEAGVRDRWALAAISAAGIGYTTGQMALGLGDVGKLPTVEGMWNELQGLTNQIASGLNPFD